MPSFLEDEMITTYLSLYLVFVIFVTLIISLIVLRLRLPSPRLIVILMVVFILSPLIIGYFYVTYFSSIPEVVVPDVTGMMVDAAKEKLEALDLQAKLAGSVYEMKYPEGYIVSQRPEAGRRVKVGRIVSLMISSGKRKVTVPNLLGRPLSQVDTVLSAAELQLGEVRSERNLEAPEGTVLAQEPLPGEEAEMGKAVDLLVSTTMEVIVPEATPESDSEEVPTEERSGQGGFKLW